MTARPGQFSSLDPVVNKWPAPNLVLVAADAAAASVCSLQMNANSCCSKIAVAAVAAGHNEFMIRSNDETITRASLLAINHTVDAKSKHNDKNSRKSCKYIR